MGMRTKTIIIDRDTTDITTDDEDWRELMPGLSSRGQFSGACVFKDDAAINIIENLASSGAKDTFRIKFDSGDTIDGDFLVQDYEYAGEFGDSQLCNLTLLGDELTLTRLVVPVDLWVAAGEGNKILTSTDGSTWTDRTSPLDVNTRFNTVGYNGTDLWVLGTNDGEILTSPDGITWTERTFAGANTHIVRFSNSLWIMSSADDVYTSPDGITWTFRDVPVEFAGDDTSGLAHDGSGTSMVFSRRWNRHLSTDGTTWGSFLNSGVSGAGVQTTIDHDKSGLWVRATGTVIRTSEDGTTWVTRETTTATNDVAFGNGLWVVVGDNGVIFTSSDGTTWTSRTSGTSEDLFRVESNQDDLWVAVGGDGASRIILTSADGITWTERLSESGSPLIAVSINQVV